MSGSPQVRHQWGRSPPSQPPNASRGPSPKIEVPPGAVCRVRLPTPASYRHRYSDGGNDPLSDFGKTIPRKYTVHEFPPPSPSSNVNINPASPPQPQQTGGKSPDHKNPRPRSQGRNTCMLHIHSPHGHGDGASPPPFSFLVTAAPRGPGSGSVRDLGSGVRASQPAIQAEAGSIETPDSAKPGRGATPGRVTRSPFFKFTCSAVSIAAAVDIGPLGGGHMRGT